MNPDYLRSPEHGVEEFHPLQKSFRDILLEGFKLAKRVKKPQCEIDKEFEELLNEI